MQHLISKLRMPFFINFQRWIRLLYSEFFVKLHYLVIHVFSGLLDKGFRVEYLFIQLVNSIVQLVLKFSELAFVCEWLLWRLWQFRLNHCFISNWVCLNGFIDYSSSFRWFKVRSHLHYIQLYVFEGECTALLDVCYAIAVCINRQISLYSQKSLVNRS